jgi:L-asparaginase
MIRLVATGGTIASLPDASGAVRPAVAPEDLLAGVPALADFGPITVDDVVRVNGWNVDPDIMLRVARHVAAATAGAEVSGVIVTHGTDTVEETAFLCDLLVPRTKPVVFAAAMRSGDEVAADGPRNLVNAATVASSPEAASAGVVVTLNDEIHAARWVRKQDSFRVSAFASPGHGPIGVVVPGDAAVHRLPPAIDPLPIPSALDRYVPVVQTYTGMPPGLIDTILEATEATGVVLEGTGLGNVPGTALEGIKAALGRGIPVVVATRVPTGGTRAVYGGPGGGVTLRSLGVTAARNLSAAKARLLLMAILAGGLSGSEASAAFEDYAARLV